MHLKSMSRYPSETAETKDSICSPLMLEAMASVPTLFCIMIVMCRILMYSKCCMAQQKWGQLRQLSRDKVIAVRGTSNLFPPLLPRWSLSQELCRQLEQHQSLKSTQTCTLSERRQDPGKRKCEQARNQSCGSDATPYACLKPREVGGGLHEEQTRRDAVSVMIEAARNRKYCTPIEFDNREGSLMLEFEEYLKKLWNARLSLPTCLLATMEGAGQDESEKSCAAWE